MPDRYSTLHLVEDQYEPGSNGTVLRNLLGITSKEEMEHVEEKRFGRLMEDAASRFDSDHRFSAQDILWLHKTWLDGVYAWAGACATNSGDSIWDSIFISSQLFHSKQNIPVS